jgi:hypothetical protein
MNTDAALCAATDGRGWVLSVGRGNTLKSVFIRGREAASVFIRDPLEIR